MSPLKLLPHQDVNEPDPVKNDRLTEESHVRLRSRLPEDAGTRKRIENLLGGRFIQMYELSKMTHEHFGLSSFDDVTEAGNPPFPGILPVVESFSPMDYGHAATFQEPSLILSPPSITSEELLKLLSDKHAGGVKKGPSIQEADYVSCDPDSLYRSFIIEGGSNMEVRPGDVRMFPLSIRLRFARTHRKDFEWGLSGVNYTKLVMQSIVRGDIIDNDGSFTILDGEDEIRLNPRRSEGFDPRTYIPIGHCTNGVPAIEMIEQHDIDSNRGFFRRVLGGRLVKS